MRFQCDQCNYIATEKDNLQSHKHSVHKTEYIQCQQCNYKAPRRNQLQTHIKSTHEQGQSSIIGFIKKVRFEEDNRKNIDNHNKVNIEEKSENNESITSTQIMIQDARERRKNKVKKFNCEKCDYKSSSNTLMNKHIQINHTSQSNSQHQDTETDHENIQNIQAIEVSAAKIRKRFSCKTCNFKATNESKLKIHVGTNHTINKTKLLHDKTKTKRIHCEVCDKRFNKKETFNRHIMIHQKPSKQIETQKSIGRSTIITQNGNEQSQVDKEHSRATMITVEQSPIISIIND